MRSKEKTSLGAVNYGLTLADLLLCYGTPYHPNPAGWRSAPVEDVEYIPITKPASFAQNRSGVGCN